MFRDDPDPFSEWWSMMVFVNMAGNTWKWKPSSDANSGNIFIEWIRCAGGLGGGGEGLIRNLDKPSPCILIRQSFKSYSADLHYTPPRLYVRTIICIVRVSQGRSIKRGFLQQIFFLKFTYQKVNWSAIFPLFRHQLIGLKYKTN